eukprot:s2086_g7.t1
MKNDRLPRCLKWRRLSQSSRSCLNMFEVGKQEQPISPAYHMKLMSYDFYITLLTSAWLPAEAPSNWIQLDDHDAKQADSRKLSTSQNVMCWLVPVVADRARQCLLKLVNRCQYGLLEAARMAS